MAQKRSKFAKVFIFLTLIFIVFASFAVYIVMYAWFSGSNNNTCPEWYIINEETWECEEENLENNTETTETEETIEEVVAEQVTEENTENIVTPEISEENIEQENE